MEFQQRSVAAGFQHSAAISGEGKLYLWGDNNEQQLKPFDQYDHQDNLEKQPNMPKIIPNPNHIPLQYAFQPELNYSTILAKDNPNVFGNKEYEAMNLACGPFCTFVIAVKEQKPQLIQDQESKEILKEMRKYLIKDGSLVKFFKLWTQKDIKDKIKKEKKEEPHQKQELTKIHENNEKANIYYEQEDITEFIIALENSNPFLIEVEFDLFVQRVEETIKLQKQNIINLAQSIQMYSKIKPQDEVKQSGKNTLVLGDIEDQCLGFLQHNTKLFLVGQAPKCLRAFEYEVEEFKEIEKQQIDDQERIRLAKTQKVDMKTQIEIKVVPKPTAIQFPKFTKPIIAVSAGSGHVLALTLDQQMFSWGLASYGALGFGYKNENHVYKPQRLDIFDFQGKVHRITQISCGKFHSICLTSRQNIFSWGEGSQGRLGHGDQLGEDVLEPREIYQLSQRKPIFISAGESHSASITEKYQLFTWGNGGFGRLGHGVDTKEIQPRLVESLTKEKITFVSCGSFHTLAVNNEGTIFSFGQNKYGKLGMSGLNTKEGEAYMQPVKIKVFKNDDLPETKKEIIHVVASFNHSLALSKTGKLYTWGYSGKGILGRQGRQEQYIKPMQVQGGKDNLIGKFMSELNYFKQNMIENIAENVVVDQVKSKKEELKDMGMIEEVKSFFVKEICCGAVNTVVLTNTGTVIVFGDNTYGQRACEELDDEIQTNHQYREFGKYQEPSLIDFKHLSDKIKYVACGGYHMFVQSGLDEIHGWGRSDEGQLGVGYLTDKITQPVYIKDLSYKGIKQICCADNYTAALSIYGEVFVAGSLDGGKLGLGKGLKRGYQLNFTSISGQYLPPIEQISCGVQHMLAISRYNTDPEYNNQGKHSQMGKTYAWGKNQRGQLGIGNKINQYSPQEIEHTKERFKKVVCGYNFSIGLSTSNKAYFWGNYKYFCDRKIKKDQEEPQVMSCLETREVLDISCDYKQCYALVGKGEIIQWGRFLLDKEEHNNKQKNENKVDGKKDDADGTLKIMDTSKFPAGQKDNIYFQTIVTGPNHGCGISLDNKVYVWGHNNMQNRLGLESKSQYGTAKIKPLEVKKIHEILQEEKEAFMKQAGHDYDENVQLLSEENEKEESSDQEMEVDSSKDNQDKQSDKKDKQVDVKDIEVDVGTSKKKNKNNQKQIDQIETDVQNQQLPISTNDLTLQLIYEIAENNKKKKQQNVIEQLNVLDENMDLIVLEQVRQELYKKLSPQIVDIVNKNSSNDNIMEQNQFLQKQLKKENQALQDEQSIIQSDIQIQEMQKNLLYTVYEFSKIHISNKEQLLKCQRTYLGKIFEVPFKVDKTNQQRLKNKGVQPAILKNKKQIQKIFAYLQLHPCYIIKILKSDLLSLENQKKLIKYLFSSNKPTEIKRLNYLLISVFEEILTHEIQKQEDQGQIDLLERDKLISIYIFRHIFNSQQTNMDTIACIACHFLNYIFNNYSQTQPNQSIDTSLDVADEVSEIMKKLNPNLDKNDKKNGPKKTTMDQLEKRQREIMIFLRNTIDAILNNQILKDTAQCFSLRKKIQDQLDFVKKELKAVIEEKDKVLKPGNMIPMNNDNSKKESQNRFLGIDPEQIKDKLPSFRFSEDIFYMIQIIIQKLKNIQDQQNGETSVSYEQQVLGLLFDEPLEEIENNFSVLIYPYVSKIKMLTQIEQQMEVMHQVNKKNAFLIIRNFMKGSKVFVNKNENPQVKELNLQMNQYFGIVKNQLIQKLSKYGREISQIKSFKNFEYQLIHSLEQEDTFLVIQKQFLGTLLNTIQKHKKEISLQDPETNDPLIRVLNTIPRDDLSQLDFEHEDDFMRLKLKTRLFMNQEIKEIEDKKQIEDKISYFCRCKFCQATLTIEIAVQNYEKNIILSRYEPQDKQTLALKYCDMLKLVDIYPTTDKYKQSTDDKNIHKNMQNFINEARQQAKRAQKYFISDAIQEFNEKFQLQTQLLKIGNQTRQQNQKQDGKDKFDDFKSQNDYNSKNNQSEMLFKKQRSNESETVMYDLITESEEKLNLRIIQQFNQILIKNQIEKFLLPNIKARIEQYKNDTINNNVTLQQNYQFGHANNDFFDNCDKNQAALPQMTAIKKQKSQQNIGNNLKDNLPQVSQKTIRGYLQTDVQSLLNNKTIVNIKLVELTALMPKCNIILIESEDQRQIEFKLVYREIKKVVCGPDKVLQEQIMLQFNINPRKMKEQMQKISEQIFKLQKERDAQIKKLKSDIEKIVNDKSLQNKVTDMKRKLQKLEMGLDEGDSKKPVLVFEESDAIEFDPEKFQQLIMTMEKAKSAYGGS